MCTCKKKMYDFVILLEQHATNFQFFVNLLGDFRVAEEMIINGGMINIRKST